MKSVNELRKDVAGTNDRLDASNAIQKTDKEALDRTNKMLGGFIGNQAASAEEEVVKAVCFHLGVGFEEVQLNRKFYDHYERLIA
jgi:nitrogenase subunit NifH